jgi:L-arabinose isomerase
MKGRVEKNVAEVESRLLALPCEVANAGLVDNDGSALDAGLFFCREAVDLIVCYLTSYGTSDLALRVIQRRRVPVLILSLQPTSALDYDRANTEDMLVYCSTCGLPEVSNVFARARIDFNLVTGVLSRSHPSGDKAWKQVESWVAAAGVAHNLQTGRIGFLGHAYHGMLDMYADCTMHQIQLGSHIEMVEMCDLDDRVNQVHDDDVQAKLEEVKQQFVISEDSASDPLAVAPTAEQLIWSTRVACGMEKLVDDLRLDGLASYYRGVSGGHYQSLAASLILGGTLLTGRGIPCSGEGDLKNCFAMYIMELLGAGGAFAEFYAMDADEEFMLIAHDGPGNFAISDSRPTLRGLGVYHGKRGTGVSVEFRVKLGPVTILGMAQTAEGRLKLIMAEGESIAGPVLRIGNTCSRIDFHRPAADFLHDWTRHGPTHHFALGIGHLREKIECVAKLMSLELECV